MIEKRSIDELEGQMKQIIMQKTWLRKMTEDRCRDLDSWQKTLEYELKKFYPEHISSVPSVCEVGQ